MSYPALLLEGDNYLFPYCLGTSEHMCQPEKEFIHIKRNIVSSVPGYLRNWVDGVVLWDSEEFTGLGHALGRHQ